VKIRKTILVSPMYVPATRIIMSLPQDCLLRSEDRYVLLYSEHTPQTVAWHPSIMWFCMFVILVIMFAKNALRIISSCGIIYFERHS